MKWAIQATMLESWKTDEWADAAIAADQEVYPVYLRAFEEDIDRAVDFDMDVVRDVIWFGSTKLIKLISKDSREFAPGVFFNEAFDYQVSIADNPGMMLNEDAEILDLDDITYAYIEERGPTFVRPVLDLKSFTGGVVNPGFQDYHRWLEQCRMGGVHQCQGIDVVASTPKKILSEYRCFVVADKPPQIRQYRSPTVDLCSEPVGEDKTAEITEYLKDVNPPHEVCVIDVAETDKGMYVIEFNTFNGSGTYGHDCNVIVQQLMEYADERNY